jgi:hypothetical protein
VSASSKDTSSTTMQILKQLDQRSAYVSSDGTFVRITQRGMSSVNLNGRFNEQVQLYIPRASEPFYVIEPTTTNTTKFGIQLKTITEPLYSRVDAVVTSVVVVRHPTKLRRTNWETFGLLQEDAADEDFIVGLARPAKVRLWDWARNVNIIYTSDLDFTATKTTNNVQIYFDSPTNGLYEAERLELASFADPQTLAFLGKITRAIRTGFDTNCLQTLKDSKHSLCDLIICKEGPETNCFISVTDTNTGITIRLGQKNNSSKELDGFSSLEKFFPSYNKDAKKSE